MAFIAIQRNTSITQTVPQIVEQCESNEQINYSFVDSVDHCLDSNQSTGGNNECYFAVRGAAIILADEECIHLYKSLSKNSSTNDIQKHLQSMFRLLRTEDILKMAVKLESIHANRTRYLIIVNSVSQSQEESCLLGIDYNNEATIGLVLPVWADTRITLDGDGGFTITSYERHHIFKPVSVQAMWTALQALHRASAKARVNNYYENGSSHRWISYYEKKITFDRFSYNEWHATDDLINNRPPSPDLRTKPPEQVAIEQLIRAKLKEVMMAENLDEVTSKYIRTKLEKELGQDLSAFKSFIDEEMLRILGQMDESSQIFDYLFLGSEWNASNFEELKGKGVGKILNVTREIDNFFPEMFDYYNIRVYDDDSTEMLKYWDNTFKYIRKAKEEGSKVLVHCKKGISRSASVVLAFVMKETGWRLEQALEYVKNKRNCIRPNSGFLKQLEIYEGILDASKQRHNSLWKSKSETNLVSKDICLKRKSNEDFADNKNRINKQLNSNNDSNKENSNIENLLQIPGSVERPKSWSPEDSIFGEPFVNNKNSNLKEVKNKRSFGRQRFGTDPSCYNIMEAKKNMESKCNETSILDTNDIKSLNCPRISIVKDRITDFETFPQSQSTAVGDALKANSTSGLVYNLTNQFESTNCYINYKKVKQKEVMTDLSNIETIQKTALQSKPPIPKSSAKYETQESCDKSSKCQSICLKTKSNEYSIDIHKYYTKEESTELETTTDPTLVPTIGNVINTRRKLNENHLKRTNSYDSILKELSLSLFESQSQPKSQHMDSKGHKRSASLFCRTNQWTAVSAPTPLTSRWPSNRLSCSLNDRQKESIKADIPHSKSMPSVIEAVNDVLFSTRLLMESIPNSKSKSNFESSMECESNDSRIQSNETRIQSKESRIQSNLSKSLNESVFSENRISVKKSYIFSRNIKDSNGVVRRLTEKIEAKVKGNNCSDSCECDSESHHSHSTPSSPNFQRNERQRSSTFDESIDQKCNPLRKTSFEFPFKRIKSQSFDTEIQTNRVFTSELSSNSSNKLLAKTSKKSSESEMTHKSQTQTQFNAIEPQIECKSGAEVSRRGPQKKAQQGRSHPLTRLIPQSSKLNTNSDTIFNAI